MNNAIGQPNSPTSHTPIAKQYKQGTYSPWDPGKPRMLYKLGWHLLYLIPSFLSTESQNIIVK